MNGLIIGALFAVALLALIGVVFFARGEPALPQAQDQAPNAADSSASDATNKDVETSAETDMTLPATPAPNSTGPHLPARREDELTAPLEIGQVHELAMELRTLHQQALELGQRLNVLTEIADHIERVQENYVSVTEDK